MTEDEYWFRYAGYTNSDGRVSIGPGRYKVIRHTPAGVVLDVYGEPKFVLNVARKRWAYPTIAEALNSFYHRKKWHVGYLAARHDRIQKQWEAVQKMIRDGETVLDTDYVQIQGF